MLSLDALQARLSRLDSTDALRQLFADWSYEVDFGSDIFLGQATKADERAQESLAKEPEIIARAGEFEIIYAPLKDWQRAIGAERLVISQLLNDHPFALWIFSDESATKWHWVNVKRGAGKGAAAMSRHVLRRFSFQKGETAGRTSIEQVRHIDVAALPVLPGRTPEALEIQARHDAAFDVEAVTLGFFRDYKMVFESVEKKVKIKDEGKRRLWTQRLFNRLMFLRFLEKKGWLEYDGDKNYLRALFKAAKAGQENFLDDRLYTAFFYGLNQPNDVAPAGYESKYESIRGKVPFLNGGLFDLDDEYDVRGVVKLDNGAFEAIFDLFDRYNFTITESTPFDQEIGVDPEMLGKVFEELVTGRHESGSYYTPRGIVSFMGREALKGTLEANEKAVDVARFVDEGDASFLANPEQVLGALREVRICDPACGSGAYLLGMMQELLRLREALFIAKAKDHRSIFKRKLEIIENNLYGVDKDPFAVNITMLRLWLSLIIEFEGEQPPPLPNLNYKIGCGDSLSAPLAGASQLVMHDASLRQFVQKKGEFLRAFGSDKKPLQLEIETLRDEIRLWTHAGQTISGFDWVVEFAEVFAPRGIVGARYIVPAHGKSGPQSTLSGGFDIVLANPPYVRHELITEQKPQLKTIFGAHFSGTADLYVFFYLRGHELLKPGGMLSFISPNKWFRAAYGAKLRKYFAEQSDVRSITDFGDLPVFQAATAYPMVFVAQKSESKGTTQFALVKSLAAPYPDVRAVMDANASTLPANALDGENWNLSDAATSTRLQTMRKAGVPLGEYVKGQIYYGVKTGFNEAFVIDDATRLQLIKANASSAELIKPLVAGRDIRKWAVDYKSKWLIFTRRGTDIKKYPAIEAHLKKWKAELTPKANGATIGRKPGRYKWFEIQDEIAYYSAFDKPKILYPVICKTPMFAFDKRGAFTNDKGYIISISDLYLLGVLNSAATWEAIRTICSPLAGGFWEMRATHLVKIPIPTPSAADRSAIEGLVEACLQKKGAGCADEEAEINARVATLYGL